MSDYGYNIFYTDDDADDQEIFRDVVAAINERIYIFTQNSGDELLDLLKSPPPRPHVIFLDLNMPVKNGYEVLHEIRTNEKTNQIPVVIFSTSNDETSIASSKKLGASLYVHKPSSYAELKQVLRHVLSIKWETFRAATSNFVYNKNAGYA